MAQQQHLGNVQCGLEAKISGLKKTLTLSHESFFKAKVIREQKILIKLFVFAFANEERLKSGTKAHLGAVSFFFSAMTHLGLFAGGEGRGGEGCRRKTNATTSYYCVFHIPATRSKIARYV